MWPLGTPMSMILFTSTHPNGADFDPNSPLLVWDNLTYGGWKDERVADLDLQVPESVRLSNGSWFLDVMLVKGGGSTVAGKPQGDIAVSRKRVLSIGCGVRAELGNRAHTILPETARTQGEEAYRWRRRGRDRS